MNNDDDTDRISHLVRNYNDGERTGAIRGALRATGKPAVAVMRDLIRRYGCDHIEREFADYPDLKPAYDEAKAELASATTDRISMRELEEPAPNSPRDVGAQGEPGGWTGGLTHPPEQQPTQRKRVRREDSR